MIFFNRIKLRPFLLSSMLSILGLFWPAELRAQYNGVVALQTVQATVANNATCTGSSQTFSTATVALNKLGFVNIGQTSHLATATSNATTFTLEIDGVDSLGNVFRLSDLQVGTPTSAKGGLVVTASGYMTNIQVAVTCSSGSTFSISYSGSFSPNPPNIAGALLVATDKLPFQTAPANATASTTFQSPSGNSGGTIIFQYSGVGPSGSSITAQCLSNSGSNLQSFPFLLSTVATAQLFTVTQASCPFVTLTYTSGGASAVTYNLEYVFNQTGSLQTLSTSGSGTSNTTPIQVVSDSTAQSFSATNFATNPAGNVLYVGANAGAHTLYFDHLNVICSAACTLTIVFSTSAPGGCSIGSTSQINLKLGGAVTPNSTATVSQGCASTPGFNFQNIPLGAGQVGTFDLRGVIAMSGSSTGLGVLITVTGTFSVAAFWYER